MKAEKGKLLGGRYLLGELIATGGMGEVWTAQDTSVGRTVAVKVLRDEYTGNQEFLRRLRTEARNSASLAHPNIAQMYDYGEEAGTGFLVMELVAGESLADLLDRQPTIPTEKLIPIIADTARGLDHAHQNAVVHRDVKPGNILLEDTLPGAHPKVKITDFGVSLAANQAPMTATGMVMGTAQYLSPEQAVGKPATPRSDLYALGVIAYEATVGKRPFTGKSPVDIAIAHVNDPHPPLPPSVDPRFSAVIERLLEKNPDHRHDSAGALADDLDRLLVEVQQNPASPAKKPTSRLGARSARSQAAGVVAETTATPLVTPASDLGSSPALAPRRLVRRPVSPVPGSTTSSYLKGSDSGYQAQTQESETDQRKPPKPVVVIAVIIALLVLYLIVRSFGDNQAAALSETNKTSSYQIGTAYSIQSQVRRTQ
jgi:serine/threonine-protein kinase